jgi:hypothetical protein
LTTFFSTTLFFFSSACEGPPDFLGGCMHSRLHWCYTFRGTSAASFTLPGYKVLSLSLSHSHSLSLSLTLTLTLTHSLTLALYLALSL